MCQGLAGALAYLHSQGVCHGDVYAHNIMLEGDSHAVLCDFGAAFCYDPAAAGRFWEAMEVLAFGLFMQGLVDRIHDSCDGTPSGGGGCGCNGGSNDGGHMLGDGSNSGSNGDSASRRQEVLQQLVGQCLAADASSRPSFTELEQALGSLLQ